MRKFVKIAVIILGLLTLAFVIFRMPDTDPAEMRAKYGPAPSQFVKLKNGQTIHLRDEGPRDAPPIILLHGSNADLHTWNPWAERLKDKYRIIRFDQPGHGLTGASPDKDYSVQSYVETIDMLADRLGLSAFYLAGNSMGGKHTLAYALAHPGRVKAMILVDAAGGQKVEGASGNIGFTIAQTPGLNQTMKYITPRNMVEESLRQSVSNQAVVTPEAIDRYWEMLRYPGNREATIIRFQAKEQQFTQKQMASLAMPTLILWGDKDALIPLSSGEWLHQNLPNSELVVFKNIGHLPMEETPDASAATVRKFMERAAPQTKKNPE